MPHRTIPQRELRNNISAVLREAEAGTEFTITVRGRPVAKLRPLIEEPGPRAVKLADMRASLAPVEDPWNDE